MRKTLDSKRFRISWELMTRQELPAVERVVALDGVRRILAASGSDLDNLLKHALIGYDKVEQDARDAAEAKAPPTETERFKRAMHREASRNGGAGPGLSDIGDIFSSRARDSSRWRGEDPMVEREARMRRDSLRQVRGPEVPSNITGTVSDLNRMTMRGTTMLSFRIENPIVIYGPLFATETSLIELIEASDRHKARVRVTTELIGPHRDIPMVQQASIAV
jgi:hypothetical protein